MPTRRDFLRACLLGSALPTTAQAGLFGDRPLFGEHGLLGDRSSTYQRAPKGSPVTHIIVRKSQRTMYLMHHNGLVVHYRIQLGFSPKGHKTTQGDGKTPEGRYHITHRNPQSRFHLSLGISYPNAADRRQARARGVSPGGDIFIHGRGQAGKNRGRDWTAGCIAVEDHEMDEIYALVQPGIPIFIQA